MARINGRKNEQNQVNQCRLEELTMKWLEYKRFTVKESSIMLYTTIVNTHILPKMGNLYMDEITEDIIEQCLKDIIDSGRAIKTVQDIIAVLRQILKFSVKQGFRTEADFEFRLPRAQRRETEILTLQDQRQLEHLIFGSFRENKQAGVKNRGEEQIQLGILIALYCGLRIGEVCALQWKNIDPETKTLRVDKTLIRIKEMDSTKNSRSKLVFETPKTACSLRTIPIPDFLCDYLMRFRRDGDDFVISGTKQFIEPRAYQYKYKRILAQAGVPSYTFHSLRHTFATRCVENEMDVKSLSEIMGHSNVTITMQRYVHPTIEQKRKQINRLPCPDILLMNME